MKYLGLVVAWVLFGLSATSHASDCIDSDGDGWGWNGVASCLVPATQQVTHECIDSDGDGWGWNGTESCRLDGQLPVVLTAEPLQYVNLNNPTDVFAGHSVSCAIDESGLVCWGHNLWGQTDVPSNIQSVQSIGIGVFHTCALTNNRDYPVSCWGSATIGNLNVPTGLQNPRVIDVDRQGTNCIVDEAGVSCLTKDLEEWFVPENVRYPDKLSLENGHACAIENFQLTCWGRNEFGQSSPPELYDVTDVSTSGAHTCAIAGGEVVCWGISNFDRLDVPEIQNPISLSTGTFHACAVDRTDSGEQVVCWGRNDFGQTRVPPLDKPQKVVAGFSHTCALDTNGVICWGDNERGQLGTDQPTCIDEDGNGWGWNGIETCIVP